jgi:hypothetical protein
MRTTGAAVELVGIELASEEAAVKALALAYERERRDPSMAAYCAIEAVRVDLLLVLAEWADAESDSEQARSLLRAARCALRSGSVDETDCVDPACPPGPVRRALEERFARVADRFSKGQ